MLKKLEELEKKFISLEQQMSDGAVAADQKKFQELARSRSAIEPIVDTFREYRKVLNDIDGNRDIIYNEKDADLVAMAKEELQSLEEQTEELEQKLKILLLPKDPNDEKNVIVEIRAGTGGDEAAIFCADLFRMYSKYAETRGWNIEIMSSSPTGVGGFKEIFFMVSGESVYSRMKYESGTHRVQRVPVTETQGRIHTSAVTVAVLPEAEDVEVDIAPEDLRIDVFRSSGHGGQSVNTTDSAVRITHLPSGLVVSCQDEKSQLKNKAKAMKVLKARLLDLAEQQAHDQRASERKTQVGTGDRSGRIRTYNFPQSRVTDHRINVTLHQLDSFMNGELDEVIDGLITHYQTEKLKSNEG